VRPIQGSLAKQMTGVSWRPGCPVQLRDLRVIEATHWGFDGRSRTGRLIVHGDVASDVLGVLRRLYAARFPIRRMVPVDAYGASDFRSIEADNTSAFNCRYVEGTRRWSEHAYGRAIDLNPIENPYVSGGRTSHRASVRYLDRSQRRPGMAFSGGVVVEAFRAIGWGWGGNWSSVKDYQHFSASGR
jgi:D-alanyl-D-alanine carboxypeptidase